VRHKSRLRRLEARVHWLETEGVNRGVEYRLKIFTIMLQMADRLASDPDLAANVNRKWPGLFDDLPPPSPHLRPRAAAPVVVAESPPPGAEALADAPATAADAPPRDKDDNDGRKRQSELSP
jgi:hypothetical protein